MKRRQKKQKRNEEKKGPHATPSVCAPPRGQQAAWIRQGTFFTAGAELWERPGNKKAASLVAA
ncbi:hypothetical protein MJ863_00045 [Alcaligenes ammonioxydans]|uniref:hypothetical protein n=1 Tax=Alcaligenes ammonioxydans TaxID=2582914 RepID=UPI001F06A3FD|nr:hypothetical protein [Alcaligenes ammonioxydans]MCH1877977.1 hypothetical protein [Alcaligenes ammonioxydans]